MSIHKKLIDISDINDLFSNINNYTLKNTLIYKLSEDLETLINKYNTIYYKVYKNKRYRKNLIKNANNDTHNNIINVHNTITTFMPYILLHNMSNIQEVPLEDY